ncbi:MAG: CinA family nicotinamide mononucleotide deamidase-related protein, partial [Myxococcota bacterium]
MRIETLAIGDELLDGRVVDRNASALASTLRERSLKVERMSVVPDVVEVIAATLAEIGARGTDAVICSGGLGPTRDDCTREAAALWLGTELVHSAEQFEAIKARFEVYGVELTPNNRRQAMFPKGATVLPNEVGSAPGFEAVGPGGLRAWFFPGVPSEYRWFVERYVLSALKPDAATGELLRRTMVFFGLGESALEHALRDMEWPSWLTVGYRAHFPEIHVTLSAWEESTTPEAFAEVAAAVMERLGTFYLTDGPETLVERVARRLREAGATVAAAESCTGGLVSGALTSVSGSSAYLNQGYVTYSNAAKVELLGVREATLAAHGAVSRPVALQMARGVRRVSGSTYGIGVTGIAGPTGGSEAKPVGTVDLALDGPEGSWVRRLNLRA